MANNMHKEEWVDKVINSTQGMTRATPPADFTNKVLAGINNPIKARMMAIPVKQWAAAAILLLALNIGSVVYFATENRKTEAGNTSNGTMADMIPESTYNY